ncbi:MAG: hypothetical protein ACOC8X_07095, partial [Chloroflexota bacterium]
TYCPHCRRRLPRHYHYTLPSDGWDLFSGLTMLVAGTGGSLYVLAVRGGLTPWAEPGRGMAVVGAALFAAWLVLEGFAMRWLAGVLLEPLEDEDGAEDEPDPAGDTWDHDVHLGGDMRLVSRDGQNVHYLRERGFFVPKEPERGALSKWLFAVHDKREVRGQRITFSQRGARMAIRDNDEIRDWATDILALWCEADWCEPANGWNGDRPDLGNGVRNVDEDVLYDVARTGQSGMIEMLLELVEASVEPPHSETE